MKTPLINTLTKISLGLVLMIFSFGAYADWKWIHGTSCHEEYVDRLVDRNPNRIRFGWGLDFIHQSGTWNWIHCAVPTNADFSDHVRYIRLRFYTGSVDAWISQVHVYNGETRVKTFVVNWKNGWYTRQLDLGFPRVFDKGLGISIETKAGVESMSHQFIFSGAGAKFD